MRRAVLGAILGGVMTFSVVFVVALVLYPAGDYLRGAAIVGALLAGNGATAGAVIGAAGEFSAQFRRAFRKDRNPERDYVETASADHDPLPGVLMALCITGLVVLIVACFAFLVLTGKDG